MFAACRTPNIGEVLQKSLGNLLSSPQLSGSVHSKRGPLIKTSGDSPESCTVMGGFGAGAGAAAMAATPPIKAPSLGEGTGPIFGEGVGVLPQLLRGCCKPLAAMSFGDAQGMLGLSIGDGVAEPGSEPGREPGLEPGREAKDAGATEGAEAGVTGVPGPASAAMDGAEGTNSGAEGFHELAPKPPAAALAAAAAAADALISCSSGGTSSAYCPAHAASSEPCPSAGIIQYTGCSIPFMPSACIWSVHVGICTSSSTGGAGGASK
mmetsp:Transcript_29790/g.74915  ORF Transcript_29790/g.74915 Transcript_29790/m.74915 type:complete len:265 (-) Transcript_29790:223-1017(-)